jgi:hypothetical protein
MQMRQVRSDAISGCTSITHASCPLTEVNQDIKQTRNPEEA